MAFLINPIHFGLGDSLEYKCICNKCRRKLFKEYSNGISTRLGSYCMKYFFDFLVEICLLRTLPHNSSTIYFFRIVKYKFYFISRGEEIIKTKMNKI